MRKTTQYYTNQSVHTFSNVEIEEVTVQCSLDTSSHNGNDVIVALHVESEGPVKYVECPIAAQCKQVVRSDGLSLASFRDHV